MLPVEPFRLGGADEELRPVRPWAGVRHGQHARAGVLLGEVLVLELGPVDRLAAGAVSGGEVPALAHEPRDHAVEGGPLVVERLPGAADAFLPGAEGTEVLGGAGSGVCE